MSHTDRISSTIALLIVTLSLHAFAEETASLSAPAALDAAVARGELDVGTRGLYLLQLLHEPDRLPQQFRLPIGPEALCQTSLVLQALRDLRQASPEIRDAASRLLVDPPPDTVGHLDSEDHPIRVYYQEERDLALAENVLSMAELSFGAHVDDLGWTPPSGLDEEETPVERLDLYVVDLPSGYSGFCEPLGNNDLTPWTDALTRCQINRTSDASSLEGLVVHEMDHAFQFAEDAAEMVGAFEMFCVHTTHHIVTNDPYWLYFLPAFQEEPHRPIHIPSTSNQLYHYGSALFAEFLDQRYGEGDAALGPQLWQAARQEGTIDLDDYWVVPSVPNEPDLFDVIDEYLREEHESTFQEALIEFAEWRLLIGDLDDGAHFPDGRYWRGAEVVMAQSYDPEDLPIFDDALPLPTAITGTSYIEVDTSDLEAGEQLRVAVNLDERTNWAAQLIHINNGEAAEVVAFTLDEGEGELLVDAAGSRAVVLAVTNLGDDRFDGDDYPVPTNDFTYSLELVTQPTVTAIEPAAATAGVSGVEVVVTAAPLAAAATLDLGEGITVSDVSVEGDQLTATIDIAIDAAPGLRDVVVTNPDSEPGVLAEAFEVLALPAPTIDSVSPNELAPGDEAVLTVTGAGFIEGATAELGDGVEILFADVADASRLMLTVRVAAAAAAGPRTLTVTNPGSEPATLAGAVTITGDGDEPDDGDNGDGCSCRMSGSRASQQSAPLLLAALLLFVLRRRE